MYLQSVMGWKLDKVNNVPLVWWPFVLPYWIVTSIFICGLWYLIHRTVKVEYEGLEHCQSRKNFVYCLYHKDVGPLLSGYNGFGRPTASLANWSWHLKGVHLLLKLCRFDVLIPGTTGQDGRDGATKVVEYLKKGYSTIISPDTPGDLPGTIRNGPSYVAMKSGVPIVPFTAESRIAWVWFWSWDRKRLPFPFSTIKITFKEPIHVTKESYEESMKTLAEALK